MNLNREQLVDRKLATLGKEGEHIVIFNEGTFTRYEATDKLLNREMIIKASQNLTRRLAIKGEYKCLNTTNY